MEVMYDMVVSELKEELLSLTVKSDDVEHENYEKEHLAIEDMEKEIEKDIILKT